MHDDPFFELELFLVLDDPPDRPHHAIVDIGGDINGLTPGLVQVVQNAGRLIQAL